MFTGCHGASSTHAMLCCTIHAVLHFAMHTQAFTTNHARLFVHCRTWRCQARQAGSRWRTCACCSTPQCARWLRTSSLSCSATTMPLPPPTSSSSPPTSSCWLPRGRRSTLSSTGGAAVSLPHVQSDNHPTREPSCPQLAAHHSACMSACCISRPYRDAAHEHHSAENPLALYVHRSSYI